jgi:hypothetical protein
LYAFHPDRHLCVPPPQQQRHSGMRGLTPDQRFQFDVRGFTVIEDAVDSKTLAQLQPRLDVLEQLGRRYHEEHPHIVDERVDEVYGKQVGLHIQDSGQKLWVFDPLVEDIGLASLLACNPRVRPYVEEMVPFPKLGNFTARFQWQGAESSIHGSRDDISTSPVEGPEAGGHYAVEAAAAGANNPRLRTSAFRLMFMLSDIEPGGGALRVIPGSHKREVPWRPAGVPRGPNGNTRFEDLSSQQRQHFVELTGKAGTVVIFTHDIIHTSWHETDTYRRVVHCTYGSGSQVPPPTNDDQDAWLEYLLRDGLREPLPPGVNQNYAEEPLTGGAKAPTLLGAVPVHSVKHARL